MKLRFALMILLLTCLSSAEVPKRYQATWSSLRKYECPDWFRDVKFGIFIHWGVYSVPAFANEWYPRNMYQSESREFNHHVETYGKQDQFGYKDFIPQFKADKFDADEWMELFHQAGAKYVVPVAEHHDGFAMYKTALSRWNAAEMGPQRDIIGELARAAEKQGIVFGVSSHRIEHWWFMNNGRKFNSDVNDPAFADFYGPAREEEETPSPEYMTDWLLRCVELVDKYHPQLFWFDWWIEQPAMEPYRKSFAAYYYNKGIEWNKGVVINYKNESFPADAAVYDIERGSSKATKEQPWQTDTSIGKKSWGYIDGEENKTANEIVDVLIDIVSKNGNLLLNIGPKADGTIPAEQQQVLREIGAWLKVNGEGIYGTRPWKISGEGTAELPDESVSFNEYKSKGYTEEDIRFTQKGDLLYAFVLGVPSRKMVIRALAAEKSSPKIASISLLGSSAQPNWKQTGNALIIEPNEKYGCEHAVAFKITFHD